MSLCINYLLLKRRRTYWIYTYWIYFISNSFHRCNPSINTAEVLWIYKCWLHCLPTWQQQTSSLFCCTFLPCLLHIPFGLKELNSHQQTEAIALCLRQCNHRMPIPVLPLTPPSWRNQVAACCHLKLCNITQILFWPLKRSQLLIWETQN